MKVLEFLGAGHVTRKGDYLQHITELLHVKVTQELDLRQICDKLIVEYPHTKEAVEDRFEYQIDDAKVITAKGLFGMKGETTYVAFNLYNTRDEK